MQRERNNISGMSLVEIMAATFILLIVFGIVFVMLFVGLRSWFVSMDKLDIQQSARIGLESMCSDLYEARPKRRRTTSTNNPPSVADIVINDPNVPLPDPPVAISLRFTILQDVSWGTYFTPEALTNYASNAILFNYVELPTTNAFRPSYHTTYYNHDGVAPPYDRFLALYRPHFGPGNRNPSAPPDYAIAYFVNTNNQLVRGIFRYSAAPPPNNYPGLHTSSTIAANDIQSVTFTCFYNTPQGLVELTPADVNPDVVDIGITAAKTTMFGDNLTYSLNTRVYLRGSNDDRFYY